VFFLAAEPRFLSKCFESAKAGGHSFYSFCDDV